VFIGIRGINFGDYSEVLYAMVYAGIGVLFACGFAQLSKRAYLYAIDKNKNLTESIQSGSDFQIDLEKRFFKFASILFMSLSGVVTGFAFLNNLFRIMPPIINHSKAATALGAVLSVFCIGNDYINGYLDDFGLFRARGIGEPQKISRLPFIITGVLMILFYIIADTFLKGEPSENLLIELCLVNVQIVMMVSLIFGFWRLGRYKYDLKRYKIAHEALLKSHKG